METFHIAIFIPFFKGVFFVGEIMWGFFYLINRSAKLYIVILIEINFKKYFIQTSSISLRTYYSLYVFLLILAILLCLFVKCSTQFI